MLFADDRQCSHHGKGFLYLSILQDQPSYEMSTPSIRRRQTDADRQVNRLRNCMPERFNTLVKMHLSFLLDLDGSKLEEIIEEQQPEVPVPHKRKSSTPFSKKKAKHSSSSSMNVLFGAALTDENVARIYQLIEFLGRTENLKTEGLFRKTGNFARQRLLKEWLNEGVDLCLDSDTFTAHDCATVLKNYLGELPEPLLTERHYHAHLQIAEMASGSVLEKERLRAKAKQLRTQQLLFLLLPRTNALLLECLIDLLHRVANISENMMTSTALGTMFAPHLLCPRKLPAEDLKAISPSITKAVSFMIENGSQIFKVPKELAADIANYWREMETPNKCPRPVSPADSGVKSDLFSAKKYGSSQAVNTVISFAERKQSNEVETSNETQVALAKLYAHVQMMPESAKKKKLLKQFNRASGSSNGKHSRSRTLGEQIKKHFSSLHRHHKRRGSNDSSQCTANLPWGITKTINIDENDNIDDDVFKCNTPKNSSSVKDSQVRSPAVYIVNLSKSPMTPKSRKRHSSDSSDGSIPEKRPTPDRMPCSENEIRYLPNPPLDHKHYPYSPSGHQGKPIAMVSPITHSPITNSVKKAPPKVQKEMKTPGSRKPMMILNSPNMLSVASHL